MFGLEIIGPVFNLAEIYSHEEIYSAVISDIIKS